MSKQYGRRRLLDWEDVWGVLWEYFIAGVAYSLGESVVGWLWKKLEQKRSFRKRRKSAQKKRQKQNSPQSLDEDQE